MKRMTERRPMDEIVDRLFSRVDQKPLRQYILDLEDHVWSAPYLTQLVMGDFDISAENARAAVDYLTDLPEEDPRA